MPGKEQASVVKEGEKKKLDMKIEIEDFGPISSGKITLKPLTVFIGPNNSGKSYAAMLINSLFRSYHMESTWITVYVGRGFGIISNSMVTEIEKRLDSLTEGEEIHLSKQFTEELARRAIKQIYQENLSSEIFGSFACPLRELARIGKDSFVLSVTHSRFGIHLACQGGKLEILECPQLDIDIVVRSTKNQRNAPVFEFWTSFDEESGFPAEVDQSLWRSPRKQDRHVALYRLTNSIFWPLCLKVLEDVRLKSYYLPSQRAGIAQVYRTFMANIFRQNTGVDTSDIPKLTMGTADLVSSLIDLPLEKASLYELVRDFEEKLIEGEILHPFLNGRLSEIKYRFQGTEIPLSRASSGVSELAPILLYLKYEVNPKSILIIDEPETHLHPRNQRILARLLVRLVREGVNVIITTHSEYLLEQLRNFILLSKIEPEKRVEKYEYSEEDYLEPDEFAAYLFHYDKKSKGHKIDRVKMTKDGEFSQDEFVNVIDALYEETIKLRIDLSDET